MSSPTQHASAAVCFGGRLGDGQLAAALQPGAVAGLPLGVAQRLVALWLASSRHGSIFVT